MSNLEPCRAIRWVVGEDRNPLHLLLAGKLKVGLLSPRNALLNLREKRCQATDVLLLPGVGCGAEEPLIPAEAEVQEFKAIAPRDPLREAKEEKVERKRELPQENAARLWEGCWHYGDAVVKHLEDGTLTLNRCFPITIYRNTSLRMKHLLKDHVIKKSSSKEKDHAVAATLRELAFANAIAGYNGTIIGVGPSTKQSHYCDHNMVPETYGADDVVHQVTNCVRKCSCEFGAGCPHLPPPKNGKVKFVSIHSGYGISPAMIIRETTLYAQRFRIPISRVTSDFVLNDYATCLGSVGSAPYKAGKEVEQCAGGAYDGYKHGMTNGVEHIRSSTYVYVWARWWYWLLLILPILGACYGIHRSVRSPTNVYILRTVWGNHEFTFEGYTKPLEWLFAVELPEITIMSHVPDWVYHPTTWYDTLWGKQPMLEEMRRKVGDNPLKWPWWLHRMKWITHFYQTDSRSIDARWWAFGVYNRVWEKFPDLWPSKLMRGYINTKIETIFMALSALFILPLLMTSTNLRWKLQLCSRKYNLMNPLCLLIPGLVIACSVWTREWASLAGCLTAILIWLPFRGSSERGWQRVFADVGLCTCYTIIRKVVLPMSASPTIRSMTRVRYGVIESFDICLPIPEIGDVVPVVYMFNGLRRYVTISRKHYNSLVALGCKVFDAVDMTSRIIRFFAKEKLPDWPHEATVALANYVYNPDHRDPLSSMTSHAVAPPHVHTFSVAFHEFRERTTRLYYAGPLPMPRYTPGLFTANYENELVALKGRVLKERPPCEDGIWNEAIDHVLGDLRPVAMYTDEQYLDALDGRKKKEAEDTINEIALDGSTVADVRPKYKAFIKKEKGNERIEAGEKAPRMIQGPDPRTKYYLSLFTHPMSKMLALIWCIAKAFDPQGRMVYASGTTTIDMGRWRTRLEREGFAFSARAIDFHRWDSTIGPKPLKAEFRAYAKLGCPQGILDLFERTIATRGTTSFGLKYELEGGRHSGDPNTSVGNSLLNGALHMYVLDAMVGPANYRAAVLGDDVIVFLNELGDRRWNDEVYVKKMEDAGLNPAVEDANVETVSFCSQYFVPCNVNNRPGYVLGPKLGRGLFRVGYHTKELKACQLKGEAISRFPAARISPVLVDIYRDWIEATEEEAEYEKSYTFNRVDERTMRETIVDATPATDQFYLGRYGMYPYEIMARWGHNKDNLVRSLLECECT